MHVEKKSSILCGTIIIILMIFITIGCSNVKDNGKNSQDNTEPEIVKRFLQEAEKGCPCPLPESEENPFYMISQEEDDALSAYQKMTAEEANETENLKAQALKYQEIYYNAFSLQTKAPEEYMLDVLNKMPSLIKEYSLEKLQELQKSLITDIRHKQSIIDNFRNELNPQFAEFTGAEVKVLIQLRRAIIDEILSRQ